MQRGTEVRNAFKLLGATVGGGVLRTFWNVEGNIY